MIIARHVIEGTTTPVTICPLGDIQWAGDREELAYSSLQDHIKHCLTLPRPLFLGMGDYVDFMSPSNRDAMRSARLYDTARKVIRSVAEDLVDDVHELFLQETKGKWLGLLSGHHLYGLEQGGTTDTKLCGLLDAPYLGDGIAIVRLEFRDKTHTQTVTLWATHGKGYGKKPTRAVDMLAELSADWEDIDVFLMGHHTKKGKADIDRLFPIIPSRGEPRLGSRTVHFVGTGGWMKGYRHGVKTYVEDAMLKPVALGGPVVHIRPRWLTNERGGRALWQPSITVES